MSPRDRRRAELQQLWRDDPSQIVGMYHHVTGLDELGRIPEGLTIASVIEAILDHEHARGKLTDSRGSD
jgi:hypothetical protein